jgi:hypothetical protein
MDTGYDVITMLCWAHLTFIVAASPCCLYDNDVLINHIYTDINQTIKRRYSVGLFWLVVKTSFNFHPLPLTLYPPSASPFS